MIHPTHCLHVFFVSKPLGRCFSPGLIARAEIERGRKTKSNPAPLPPTPAHPASACSAFPLAAWNPSFQDCLSLFFAWAVLAWAENGHPQFWKEKFPAILMDPDFFLFECLGGEGFLVFSPYSPCVPIKFPKGSLMCSKWHLGFMDIRLPTIQLPCT